MSVTVAGRDAPALVDTSVVTLGDGSLGLVSPDPSWLPADGTVVLTAGDRRLAGTARVVRSGPAYEETRGRLRAQAGRLARWRLRRDQPVVLVDVAGGGQAKSPSAR